MRRSHFATISAAISSAIAIAAGITPASAEEVAPPNGARPDGGGRFDISVTVHRNELSLLGGDLGEFSGNLWFETTGGQKYVGGSTLSPEDDGEEVVPQGIQFRLDASLNPYGEEEELDVPDLDESLLFRSASTSDLAIVPMRMIVPHVMEFEGGKSRIEVNCTGGGATVEMEAKRLGTHRIEGVTHDLVFTRVLRRLQPSGYQIHDYVLTAKDPGEDFIIASFALRILAHPTYTVDGRHPDGGALLVTTAEANQCSWRRGRPECDESDMRDLRQKFEQQVSNFLFKRMEVEGVGDPFDSPAALALSDIQLLDERTAQRLINTGHPKAIAMLSALLVETRFSYEPDTHVKLWKKENDPARRLLLAAGARFGGSREKAFLNELQLALHSSDPVVLRAAACLAKALGDSTAEKEALRKANAG